jgi:hypothetical protein
MKFIQKKLVSDNDLQEYSENYYKIILVKLDLEFLRGRDVYGFYGDHGGMIGGYTINNRPPYRILKLIPEDLEEGRKFQETYAGEFSELIAMWKASRSKLFHALFYLQIMATVLRCNSKWLLGAAVKKHAHDLYLKFLPNVIYAGEPDYAFQKAGGTGNEKQVWIQYGDIRRLKHLFSIEGSRFVAQQFCKKILPTALRKGKFAAPARALHNVVAVACYPLARVSLFLATMLGLVQRRFEEKDSVEQEAPNSF